MSFLSKLDYRKVGKVEHELLSPLLYITNIMPKNAMLDEFLLTVPMGFITDGASIPKFIWSFVGGPLSGRYVKAAILHDYLYCIHLYPRHKADLIFLEAMKSCNVRWIKRNLMYKAVRLFGHTPYHKHDNDIENVSI